jgi:uncharacterized repeat protein (TIGR03803 family)
MLSHGILYGTTVYGGSGSDGAVYSLTPPTTAGAAWTFQVLHNFTGAPADGAYPVAAPVMGAGGVLYGTASAGGSGTCGSGYNAGCGIVYSLSPPVSPGGAWTENILYNFNTNGASLYSVANAGVVIGSNGTLYGTATYGGADNQGFLYSLTPPTSSGRPWTETVLHSFTGSTGGAAPESNVVIGKSGELYGTTAGGGVPYPGYGTAFSVTP